MPVIFFSRSAHLRSAALWRGPPGGAGRDGPLQGGGGAPPQVQGAGRWPKAPHHVVEGWRQAATPEDNQVRTENNYTENVWFKLDIGIFVYSLIFKDILQL